MAIPGTHSEASSPQTVRAKAANAPATLASHLFVKIPSYGGEEWGPVSWVPKAEAKTMPKVGDECLVAFDEVGNPWVICWA